MSILIKGMEMPTRCMDCPFMVSRDNDDCILQSNEANANFKDWDEMKASCPLIHIPPHGRLIDADKLRASFPAPEDWRNVNEALHHVTGIWAAIDAAETVLPAEEGE